MLNQIFNEINNGKVFGYMMNNVKYPFFNPVLYLTNGGFIGWTNFGSSANKNTIKDLEWILDNIFCMTADEFLSTYTCE